MPLACLIELWLDFGLIQSGLIGFDLGLIAHLRLQGEVKQMKDERLSCSPVWFSISAFSLRYSSLAMRWKSLALSRFFLSASILSASSTDTPFAPDGNCVSEELWVLDRSVWSEWVRTLFRFSA